MHFCLGSKGCQLSACLARCGTDCPGRRLLPLHPPGESCNRTQAVRFMFPNSGRPGYDRVAGLEGAGCSADCWLHGGGGGGTEVGKGGRGDARGAVLSDSSD